MLTVPVGRIINSKPMSRSAIRHLAGQHVQLDVKDVRRDVCDLPGAWETPAFYTSNKVIGKVVATGTRLAENRAALIVSGQRDLTLDERRCYVRAYNEKLLEVIGH